MKLQIDFDTKTITVLDDVKFKDLISELKKLLPKQWKSFTLSSSHVLTYITPYIYYPYYGTWWYSTINDNTGIYTIDTICDSTVDKLCINQLTV